ncbi:MAG: metal-dependent hydrolase [Gammaproteobacteria bacterium]|nr:metal-dependent hydrolase [Gammaproteobacteria bacterium]
MDILTQGLLGAVSAQAGARREEVRVAAGVGFGAALLADADALIRSSSDPLLYLEYHRHFTHSLFFVPAGALVAAVVLWPLLRRRLAFARLYLFALLGFALAGFLDVCTSYGTHWLWPLVERRLALNIISIVDPVFSLILITALVLALRRYAVRAARLGLVLAAGYLLLGVVQHERAAAAAAELAATRGHEVERGLVKPTLGNLVLWRSVYEAAGRFHVDAVRVGVTGTRIYEGESVAVFTPGTDATLVPPDSVQGEDIRRFARFSEGYLFLDPTRAHGVGDARYAMLPDRLDPLWGIRLDPEAPHRHADYEVYRAMSAADRQRFVDMLLGRGVD